MPEIEGGDIEFSIQNSVNVNQEQGLQCGSATQGDWQPPGSYDAKAGIMKHSKSFVLVIFILSLTLIGCSDSKTSVTGPPPVDTSPPAIPTGLSVTAGDCVVKLSWDINVVDTDLEGYNVYRLHADQSWDLTLAPVEKSCFIDCSPLNGDCIYRVTAVDISGNESAWTQVDYYCLPPDINCYRP